MRANMGSGAVQLLSSRVSLDDPLAPGSVVEYANDVAIARSGIVYFTDSAEGISPVRNAAGFWDTMQAYLLTLFNVRGTALEPASACHPTLVRPSIVLCVMLCAASFTCLRVAPSIQQKKRAPCMHPGTAGKSSRGLTYESACAAGCTHRAAAVVQPGDARDARGRAAHLVCQRRCAEQG